MAPNNLGAIAKIQRDAQQQQNDTTQQADFNGRPFILTGQFLIPKPGEVIKDVSFSCVFTEKPLFAFGGDIQQNGTITAGGFPTVSGVILRYNTAITANQAVAYVGATICAVFLGDEATGLWFHYHFTGTAMSNPMNSQTTTDSTI